MDFSIETNRLLLRPFSIKDAEAYFKMTRDKSIQKYTPGSCPISIEETLSRIQICYSKADFKRDFYLLLEEKTSHDIIGSIMLTQNWSMKDYDCAYFVAAPYRRKGYMTEALTGFINVVSALPQPIFFTIEADNIPSLKLIHQIPGITEYAHSDAYVFVLQGK